MYQKHPHIALSEDPTTKIWRFMSLEKFLFLLENQSLYFTRGDLLGDDFEGSVPVGNLQLRNITSNPDWKETASRMTRDGKRIIYVNSWHINSSEPATMWSNYAGDATGIAIQSTLVRLQQCFDPSPEDIYIGRVCYGNYEDPGFRFPEGNAFFPFLHKRLNFADERELRALYIIDPKKHSIRYVQSGNEGAGEYITDAGISIEVDLQKLVENMYVSPNTEEWVRQVVESVARKYGLKLAVHSSALSKRNLPAY